MCTTEVFPRWRSRGSKAAAWIAAAFLAALPAAAQAHDPGLSSLEVEVSSRRIVARLSLAAADARIAARDSVGSVDAFVADAVELKLDGVPLTGAGTSRTIADDGGIIVSLSFPPKAATRLTVRSAVPLRMAPGHRELLTVRTAQGATTQRMLDARMNTVDLDLGRDRRDHAPAVQFFTLGVSHILGGYDHLLFVAALLLGVRHLRNVVTIVTAFTIAHSLTLSLASFGIIRLAGAVVEPLIAASIVFVGLENLFREQVHSRWKLTFIFGLVHGLGFAGALDEVGIAVHGLGAIVPLAFFNAGVEAGQIGVVLFVWPLIGYMNARPELRFRVAPACSLLVVAVGIYWTTMRLFA